MKIGLTLRSVEHHSHGNLVFFWWAICCLVGLSVAVTLKISGISTNWSESLMHWFMKPPFNMMEQAFVPSSLVMFCVGVSITMFFTWAVMHLDSIKQRLLVVAGGAFSMLLMIPICALWQIFFNTLGAVLSLIVAGVGASLACRLMERNREQPLSPQNDEPA